MNKTVVVNTENLEDDGFEIEFDIATYLINNEIRHGVFRMGSQLEFSLFDIDIIIYNLFINHIKKCNLIFTEE